MDGTQPIKLKVCGMRDPENIRAVAALRPDYMGFIFYPGTPRYVGEAFAIPDDFPDTTRRVGVFVNATTEEVLRQSRLHRLDLVQLHGDETPAQAGALKDAGLGVIKVFSVGSEMDFGATADYVSVVDYFLFDTKGKYYGGNARAFDWTLLSRYDQSVPFFLSGGITPENIVGIRDLETLNIAAVDVNSGVETQPALKDINKIKTLTEILNSKRTAL